MKLQRRELELEVRKRDPPPDSSTTDQGPGKTLIVAVVFVGFVFSVLFTYAVLRYIRRACPDPPRFLPEKWKQRWTAWQPGGRRENNYNHAAPSSPAASPEPSPATRDTQTRERRERNRERRRDQTMAGGGGGAGGVARGGSVRSIMTLPEYRAAPHPDREVTIGREGERGGIDVVIEAPETADEEEERREEHMRSLYEIRLARQLERAAIRENAQNGRGSARTRAGGSATSLAAALAAAQERERRMSEVSYAEVGLARPDGTRVRVSSENPDRDNLPLLDSGAPMGMGSVRSGRSSHVRNSSALSLASTSTLERRRSEEIFNMGSARPSTDNRNSFSPNDPDHDPPGYAGPDWGAPPEYPGRGAAGNADGNGGDLGIPVLRIEAASPGPYPPAHLRP